VPDAIVRNEEDVQRSPVPYELRPPLRRGAGRDAALPGAIGRIEQPYVDPRAPQNLVPIGARIASSGFVSGHSTHGDRIATLRAMHDAFGVVIDPHTADGIHVGRALRTPGVSLVCLETALAAKFAGTIREALGFDPPRPSAYADLEARPQRCTVLPPDASRVEAFIAAHAADG